MAVSRKSLDKTKIPRDSAPKPAGNDVAERARINSETAKIAWKELQRFFAQGVAIYVSPELDLVDVALEISCDRTDKLGVWTADEKVGQVHDAQAIEWQDTNALLWCVVVKPWVLVQPVLTEPED